MTTDGNGALLRELAAVLPAEALVTDADVLDAHRRDQAEWAPAGLPQVLVRATCTEDVRAVLRIASARRVPVVPRGAGSGLSGGANALDGCIVLSLMRMNRVLEVDAKGMLAVVQPGVLNAEVKAAAAAHGLWYSPDPASWEFSSLGGNLATNAGGLCCVKYGVTGDAVLGLEVVLADGSVVRTGGRTVKNVAGYDLTRLFVGSEGTLGVITEATLKLRPKPPKATTLVATFPTLAGAGAAVTDIMARTRPSMLELMDQATCRAVEAYKPLGLDVDAAAFLLARSDAGGEQGVAEIEAMASCCEATGATFVMHTSDEAEGELLLTARRLAYPALERQGATLLDDVGVPLSRIPELFAAVERIAADRGVLVGTFGHAGDGNMHPTVVFDRQDAAALERARGAFDDILGAALDLGGTITGEHGVGALKQPFLGRQLGEEGLRLHRRIKGAMDPLGILNPGKVL
ncbi:FAD-binding protein [Myxococcus llanfairpwllgwyngyllgogerychwyrndrobwllllantysiliogogogochensis]|uniref:FAD-binding protein n=1 Tax=Myxococcus llanfairpwllgwyngyllgogerychwyrndrobwllllantysiliogogogochensis TaxID=2590453 RepID=A0A540X3N9_9BACT|nr:FAD-linked oxidase C-terminal domain-containing protein [Myxococcus llanfairpwllgwyngyllgogerychwyrndrobwllllantysiliogogogochensis]TQF15859.1 FAD-binding protein [Myxococcus llanfairpwllgwyngyllgogerychwyrndrobwllllantysiliogogogochensis]